MFASKARAYSFEELALLAITTIVLKGVQGKNAIAYKAQVAQK
jgi:hypothetical protein